MESPGHDRHGVFGLAPALRALLCRGDALLGACGSQRDRGGRRFLFRQPCTCPLDNRAGHRRRQYEQLVRARWQSADRHPGFPDACIDRRRRASGLARNTVLQAALVRGRTDAGFFAGRHIPCLLWQPVPRHGLGNGRASVCDRVLRIADPGDFRPDRADDRRGGIQIHRQRGAWLRPVCGCRDRRHARDWIFRRCPDGSRLCRHRGVVRFRTDLERWFRGAQCGPPPIVGD